jgi:hypothetical protein
LTQTERRQLVVQITGSGHLEIERGLWALEDARLRTAAHLNALDPAVLDWIPAWNPHSIGTLLYHIAAIEADWLYMDVLGKPFPAEIEALFPHDVRDVSGKLTIVLGDSLDSLYRRLDTVRRHLLAAYRAMSIEEFRRTRALPLSDVSPEWVLHHLCQHEAEHRSEIAMLRTQFDLLQEK